jgi:hypothetical protein
MATMGTILPKRKFFCQFYFQLFFESHCIKNSNDLQVVQIWMLDEFNEEGERSYTDRQTKHDKEYAAAWENSPPEFKQKAALLGLQPEIPDTTGMAMEYNDNYSASAHIPDMADSLDQFVDMVIERFGGQHASFIRAIADALKKPMEEELVRNRANLLGRVSCYLVQDEKGNLKARVHALLHSIPRLAAENGFPSMRSSAKVCGVSPEWLRRKRDSWCDLLEIERPANGTKSEEAKLKYRANALTNHWRNQRFKRTHEKQQQNGNGTSIKHQSLNAN